MNGLPLRHADVAHAVQLRLRSVRHILATGHLCPDGAAERRPGAWRRAVPLDAVQIACMAALYRYGCTTDEAAEIARAGLARAIGPLEGARALPLAELVRRLAGQFLVLHMARGRLTLGRSAVDVTHGPPAPRHPHSVTLDLGTIADEVAARLAETVPYRAGVPAIT